MCQVREGGHYLAYHDGTRQTSSAFLFVVAPLRSGLSKYLLEYTALTIWQARLKLQRPQSAPLPLRRETWACCGGDGIGPFLDLSPYQEDSDGLSVVSSYCGVNGGRRGYEESSLCILSPDCELYICDGDDDSTDRWAQRTPA